MDWGSFWSCAPTALEFDGNGKPGGVAMGKGKLVDGSDDNKSIPTVVAAAPLIGLCPPPPPTVLTHPPELV